MATGWRSDQWAFGAVPTPQGTMRLGVDMATPQHLLGPGVAAYIKNYEMSPNGARRVDGFERFDGGTKPSAANYEVALMATVTGIVPGDTITGDLSGASATAVAVESDRIYLILRAGTFSVGEAIRVGMTVAATGYISIRDGSPADTEYETAIATTRDYYRGIIEAVPGSGSVLGVCMYKGVAYAWRNDALGERACAWKSTGSGWAAVGPTVEIKVSASGGTTAIVEGNDIVGATSGATSRVRLVTLKSGSWAAGTAVCYIVMNSVTGTFAEGENVTVGGVYRAVVSRGHQATHGFELRFTAGSAIINEGDTVTGASSGCAGVVARATIESGDWGSAGTGRIFLSSITAGASFSNGENLQVGGVTKAVNAASGGKQTSVVQLPGGYYRFEIHNFYGSTDTRRVYGVDGVNKGFEFDGTVFTPITTGMATDTPERVCIHQNTLVYAFPHGSTQIGGAATPHKWTLSLGAAEIGAGDDVTDLMSLRNSTLAIFTKDTIQMVYGQTGDYDRRDFSRRLGARPHLTGEVAGKFLFGDVGGIYDLAAVQEFGDFTPRSLSRAVYPLIDAKIATAAFAITTRTKSHYRLFFADKTGLTLAYADGAPIGWSQFVYPKQMVCGFVGEDGDGNEVILCGGDDGYVYQLDVGTSFDGAEISSMYRTVFSYIRNPAAAKVLRQLTLELDATYPMELMIKPEFDYGATAQPFDTQTIGAVGGYWDISSWNRFFWNSAVVSKAIARLDGDGMNIGFTFYHTGSQTPAFTLQSATVMYEYRAPQR